MMNDAALPDFRSLQGDFHISKWNVCNCGLTYALETVKNPQLLNAPRNLF